MKLIKEVFDTTNVIVEERKGKKDYFIEGVFLQSELKNRNGRMYPESVMDNEVNRYIKEAVEKNRAYGELGHPDTPSINLDRVSHMIVGLRKEGTNYIGRAKIMETPMGNIARGLLDGGANLGVSSRALGSLKMNNEGVQVVQDDFMLSTAADIVADPSALMYQALHSLDHENLIAIGIYPHPFPCSTMCHLQALPYLLQH